VTDSEAARLAEARSGTYRLLARLALAEPDAELARALLDMPLFGQALAASGGVDALPALRAEYTRTFLMNVHPYESVYLDESGMLNTELSGSVLGHYREHGFGSGASRATGAPDHLGLELEFMSHLIEREAAARRAESAAVAASIQVDQVHFLEAHLLRWGPIFGTVLAELAESPLYRTLGEAIGTFLLGDYEALAAGRPNDARGA
jgi:TorA maturation chaperone TorD